MQTASKRIINSWAMYDWANSAYNLVITSTIFPAYYDAITTTKDAAGTIVSHKVVFLGKEFESASLYNYAIAFAYLVIAVMSPILSSIADYKGNKKSFMRFFAISAVLHVVHCIGLTAIPFRLGIRCAILAAIGYCGSLVFYNSYLPEIADEADRDRVSAKGFAFGYIGSVILQVVCFLFVLKPELFGIKDASFAPRLSFLLVGLWWMGFAQITFRNLPKTKPALQNRGQNIFTNGFKELNKVWQQVKQLPVLKDFCFRSFFTAWAYRQ